MTLVVEDGTGLANANSYATLLEANAYHEAHLHATDWTNAHALRRDAALMMATRTIDMNMEFRGWKGSSDQALSWPRMAVPNSDELWYVIPGASLLGGYAEGPYYPPDEIPMRLKYATIELARELLKAERGVETAAASVAKGIDSFSLGQGAIAIDFTSAAEMSEASGNSTQIFTEQVKAMLQPLGIVRMGRSSVRARRG